VDLDSCTMAAVKASTELTNGHQFITRKERNDMKARLLFVAIVVVMLGAIVATPVMTEDEEVAMFVTRVRLAYNGRSSSSSDRIVAMVHVRDVNVAAVAEATVTGEWTLPDGTVREETADTDFQGIAWFQVWAGSGTYQFCVTGVTKEGWEYDPDLSLQTCGELEVTWPFSPPR
jgi:hypothetical protein